MRFQYAFLKHNLLRHHVIEKVQIVPKSKENHPLYFDKNVVNKSFRNLFKYYIYEAYKNNKVAIQNFLFSFTHLWYRMQILNSYVDSYSHFPKHTFSNKKHV